MGHVRPVDRLELHLREVLDGAASSFRFIVACHCIVSCLAQLYHRFLLVLFELVLQHFPISLVVHEATLFEFGACLSPGWRPGCFLARSGQILARLQRSRNLIHDFADLNKLRKRGEHETSHERIEASVVSLPTLTLVDGKV